MMLTRTMGNAGLVITPIGIGLAALGRPGYINVGHGKDIGKDISTSHMEANAHKVLDAAWDGGVRYFDAARSYGKSEQFLASWLSKRSIDPNDITVASKWGYIYSADWSIHAKKHEVKVHTLHNLNTQWLESQELLSKYLNLYQIHSATLESGVLENKEVLTRLSEIKSNGVKIGLSVSGIGQAKTILKALNVRIDGVRLFDTVQATWNLLETSASNALSEAHELGVGVIIKEAMANGRLIQQYEGSSIDLEPISKMSQRFSCSIDALIIAITAAQPFADVVLSGAGTVDHIQSNLSQVDIKLHQFVAEELNYLKQDALTYWNERSALPWN